MSHSILTVDDSKTARMIVRHVFDRYDCVIREATNGQEGLVAAAQERPDIVLLDMTMPVMDGTTMLARLRANPALHDIPVIMLTGEDAEETVVRVISLGVQDYLIKPFKAAQLREKVQKLLPIQEKAAAQAATSAKTAPEVATVAEFDRAAIPESVKQLGKLIGLRDATLGDYAEIISQDAMLTDRLLRTTNARAACIGASAETTVEGALQRVGITFMLLLAISDPLIRAVVQEIRSKLGIDLAVLSPEDKQLPPLAPKHLARTVAFTGKVSGNVHVHLPAPSVSLLRERLRDPVSRNTTDSATDNQLIDTLCQGIFNTFASKLRDAGLARNLGPIEVMKTLDARLAPQEGWMVDRYTFRADELFFCVDLSVDSHIEY